MAYQATRPNLFANVGGPPPPREGVDIAGAIDSLSNAAGSFIHNAYLRRQAKQQQETAAEQQRIQNERADRAEARSTEQFNYTKEKDARDFDLRRDLQRQTQMDKGMVGGSAGGATVSVVPPPSAPPVGSFQAPSPIGEAMRTNFNAPAAPTSALAKPITPGSLGTIPQLTVGEEAPTSAHYDPTQDITEQRLRATATAKAVDDATVRARKVKNLIGTKTPDGRQITPQLAEAMVDSPSIASAMLARDPTQVHQANRQFDVEHPLSTRAEPSKVRQKWVVARGTELMRGDIMKGRAAMSAEAAATQAEQEATRFFPGEAGGAPAPVPATDPGGNVDLGSLTTAGINFPKTATTAAPAARPRLGPAAASAPETAAPVPVSVPAPADHLASAVTLIRSGRGTLEQLRASGVPAPFADSVAAALKAKLTRKR